MGDTVDGLVIGALILLYLLAGLYVCRWLYPDSWWGEAYREDSNPVVRTTWVLVTLVVWLPALILAVILKGTHKFITKG